MAQTTIVAAQGTPTWPANYRMDPQLGLFFDEVRDGVSAPKWLSAPFEVLGYGRTLDGLGWSVILRFQDADGRTRTAPVSWGALSSNGADVRSMLADAGLRFAGGPARWERLATALKLVDPPGRITLTPATGWCGDSYVLPDCTIGPPGAEEMLFTGGKGLLNYATCGSQAQWVLQVAAPAAGSVILRFAISAAFAGPLLRPLGAEGGGFHFRGQSSSGKSTALVVAGSVWGGGRGELGFCHAWRTTSNALESLALGSNDGLLCLDEFGQVDPFEAGDIAYMLHNGQGKARSRANGELRTRPEWSLIFLSSGELSLADHMASGRGAGRPAAGQELRLIDIAAEAGANLGIWDGPVRDMTAAQRSESIKRCAREHFGHAGRQFLRRLVEDREAALARAREITLRFTKRVGRGSDSGQVRRVARRFAVIAAAGELAIDWSILPWAPGSALTAAESLFTRWAEAFGRTGAREDREVLRRLRDFIQTERSAFSPLREAEAQDGEERVAHDARQMVLVGFEQQRGEGTLYLFTPAGWARVLKGLDLRAAAKAVQQAGLLETDSDRLKKTVKVNGGNQRFYAVRRAIVSVDLED